MMIPSKTSSKRYHQLQSVLDELIARLMKEVTDKDVIFEEKEVIPRFSSEAFQKL